MKGKIKFDRKDPVMEVDDFEVIAVEILPHSVFTRFQKNMLNDYDFIVPFADDMYVDSNDVVHAMLVLDEEGEDGILINSEGSYYGRYTSYFPKAKKLIQDEIQEVAQAIIKGRFGDNGNGSWVVGFDDIKEHFDLTVTPNNGIGTMLLEELENQEEVGEIIATEDYFEITEYLNNVHKDADNGERITTAFSLVGCNLEDVHLLDKDEEVSKDYKVLSPQEIKIALAKHTLWLYSEDGNDGVQADFRNCILEDVDFSSAELNSAIFDGAKLINCDFSNSELCFAEFKDATLKMCKFNYGTADEANFRGAFFDKCNFQDFISYHGNYAHTVFLECDMLDSNLTNSCYESAVFPRTDLSHSTIDTENTVDEASWLVQDEAMVI